MNFVLFVLFLILLFLVVFFYARLRDEIKNLKGKGIAEEVKREIEGLIVEFNKISNRKIVVMDEKIKELENLLKLADEKIIKLDTITRNYAEVIKKYEILKKELQNELLISKGDTGKVSLSSQKITAPKQKELRKYTVREQNENTPVFRETLLISEANTIKDEKQLLEKEIEKIKLEDLDLDKRAELLRKLLTLEFDEDKLIDMGFSPSEIKLAKIVVSSKKV
ncbi:MAG: hypothetical protein N2712_02305 [Brevinematales bacterium]|nr:hypothetical protein [Brevinematales bacterium]